MATAEREHWVAVARGDHEPDLVLSGGDVLSVFTGEVFRADVAIADGHVVGVGDYDGPSVEDVSGQVIAPGFIDGHCHIESSKLDVGEFARAVLRHGTTAVVVDPHELANVLGTAGIDYVLRAGDDLPLRVFVMLPSCVPASEFESPAQPIEARDLAEFVQHERVRGIAEMMNYPAAIAADPAVMAKMALTGFRQIDGHAPGVTGRDLNAYIVSGPSSDHECTTVEEATEKRRLGMWIMIREASMIRNLVDLMPMLLGHGTENCMFVTDDREASTLVTEGHMNAIVREAVAHGLGAVEAVKLASLNVARYHGLMGLGAVAPGYRADLLVLPDLKRFEPSRVYACGRLVAADGVTLPFESGAPRECMSTSVHIARVEPESFRILASGASNVRVIDLVRDQVVTRAGTARPTVRNHEIVADTERDLLKVAVIERHHASGRVGLGLVRGFGLKQGAFASSIAHDAHNLVVVGADDRDMALAIQRLAEIGGGLVVASAGDIVGELRLEIAGLMSTLPAEEVARALDTLHTTLADMGVSVSAPFMYLGFLPLSVIPELRVTDRGLVDVRTFERVPLSTP